MGFRRNNTSSFMMFSLVFLSLVSLGSGNVDQVTQVKGCPFGSIYSFGDSSSLLDFKDGRSSSSDQGLLQVVDYLAYAFHLPLDPYEEDTKLDYGVNFAVRGATALDSTFFTKNNITLSPANNSLHTQIDWFQTHLDALCSSPPDCRQKLKKSIFLVGQIGANDYNYAFFQGKTMNEVVGYVPEVVQAIKDALKRLIHMGAVNLIVPGSLPMGCLPSYLTMFPSDDRRNYDKNKCREGYNNFARLHNNHLEQALTELRFEHPRVHIVYASYYDAFIALLRNRAVLGFQKSSLSKACCGNGGSYNFDSSRMCGAEGVPVCSDPTKHVHWDGIRLTEEAYKLMVEGFISGNFVRPKLRIPERWHCVM
ncbi:hypothetical protein IFM89_011739 [Coptis chinensis]|uniref:Uncharacterized protein n=1 Tax=Coptis chinensis TaxID=261450 RepID=A0A835M9S2_9MAGN|nr:hypothetical protein IFM89_011739 [Coptis chinensis]